MKTVANVHQIPYLGYYIGLQQLARNVCELQSESAQFKVIETPMYLHQYKYLSLQFVPNKCG